LIDLQHAYKTKEHPVKNCFEGHNAQLVEMVAYFWLIHLEQIFK
jgi:hypothetical protein